MNLIISEKMKIITLVLLFLYYSRYMTLIILNKSKYLHKFRYFWITFIIRLWFFHKNQNDHINFITFPSFSFNRFDFFHKYQNHHISFINLIQLNHQISVQRLILFGCPGRTIRFVYEIVLFDLGSIYWSKKVSFTRKLQIWSSLLLTVLKHIVPM
jgi:hypothetical protein